MISVHRSSRVAVCVLAVLAGFCPVDAARAQDASSRPGLPVLRAVRTSKPIVLDGRLDEPGWSEAPVAGAFRQSDARAPRSRGARVEWDTAAGVGAGVTAGIDDDGALLVDSGSAIERIVAGEVRWM
jgi:hypothetical protein